MHFKTLVGFALLPFFLEGNLAVVLQYFQCAYPSMLIFQY